MLISRNRSIKEIYQEWYRANMLDLAKKRQDNKFRENYTRSDGSRLNKNLDEQYSRFPASSIRKNAEYSLPTLFTQPYIYITPGDSNLVKNLTKIDSRTVPVGSTIRDAYRLGKFFLSTKGIIFSATQFGLQTLNKYNNTITWDPTSILLSAVPYFNKRRILNGDENVYGNWLSSQEKNEQASPIDSDFQLQKEEAIKSFKIPNIARSIKNIPINNIFLRNIAVKTTGFSYTHYRTLNYIEIKDIVDNGGNYLEKLDVKSIKENIEESPPKFNNINTYDNELNNRYASLAYGRLNVEESSYPKVNPVKEVNPNLNFAVDAPGENKLESVYKIGNQGKSNIDRRKRNIGSPVGVSDYVNMESRDTYKDFIKLKIYDINQDEYIILRAFVSGLAENPSTEWNSKSYIGRPEKVYTYSGIERKITFSVLVFAFSYEEMKPLWQKLNLIMGLNYPDYTKENIMKAPIIKLTLGGIIKSTYGFFESINITYDDDFPWEIGKIGDVNGNNMKDIELPIGAKIDFGFTVIGNEAMKSGGKGILGLPNNWYGKKNRYRMKGE